MVFYLTGIDGSGKTTLLNGIEEYHNQLHVKTTRIWARYSPRLAKILVTGFKKKMGTIGNNYNSINEEDYNKWNSYKQRLTKNRFIRFFALMILSADYYLQILPFLGRIRKNESDLILIDRFVIDFLADQIVNMGDISDTFIYKRFIKICNQFNAVFFISVKPEIALSRKNDIPGLNYLQERDRAYRNIIKDLRKGYIIDNSGPQSRALQEIIDIIKI
jgi:thymidylate kinase